MDKAEEMSHRTIVAEPGNKTYIDTYAWILFIKGKYAEAKLYMDRVLVGGYRERRRSVRWGPGACRGYLCTMR